MKKEMEKQGREARNETAVSEIIGSIIIFAFLIILLAIFQVIAVPIWNQNVEFEHSQRVQGDIGELRDNVVLSSTTGRSTTRSVELGTRYPTRLLFINPDDPTGSGSTLEPGDVRLRNIESGDEGNVGEYLDGTEHVFETRSFQYVPDYNEYGNAPRTVLDNMVLFNEVGDAQARLTDQNVVSDRNINLNLVGGNLSSSGQTQSVNINPVSAPPQVVSVSNSTAGPVEIVLPTQLNEELWLEALQSERPGNGGYVETVSYTQNPGTYNEIMLGLQRGVEYNLRMSKVTLGQIDERQRAHYIINLGDDDRTVPVGGTEQIEVEVRDRYNNPISGVTVNSTLTGNGFLNPVDPVTDTKGRAEFVYTANGTTIGDNAGIELSILDATPNYERVNIGIEVVEDTNGGGGGGGGGDGDGTLDQGTNSEVFIQSVQIPSGGGGGGSSTEEVEVRFRNEDTVAKDIVAAKFLSFYDSQPVCPCADRLLLQGSGGPTLKENGRKESLNTPIQLPAGPTPTLVVFEFSSSSGGNFNIRDQDFAFIQLDFSDGTNSMYMIQFGSN